MKSARGFSLVELLVALAVFAVMAALAYGGLDAIARTRGELAHRQADFDALVRVVGGLDRDLRGIAARPVIGSTGQVLAALVGDATRIEFTRLGYANPRAAPRSNLQRVQYYLDAGSLRRARFAVLDRATTTLPAASDSGLRVSLLRFRYFDPSTSRWLDAWPPPQAASSSLPRAVQWQMRSDVGGELQGTVLLVAAWPERAAGASQAPAGDANAPRPMLPTPPGATP